MMGMHGHTQVSVSCVEHGKLLGRLRDGFAGMFGEFRAILGDTLSYAGNSLLAAQDIRERAEADLKRNEVCVVYACL